MIKRMVNRTQKVVVLSTLKKVKAMCETKNLFYAIALILAMSFASCEDYNISLSDLEDRLDRLEGTVLPETDKQIAAINVSLDELEIVDGELQKLIDNLEAEAADLQSQIDNNAEADAATKAALEKEIANIKALIAALQEKDTELDKKIAELEAYVNSEITATEDWANATFSTLTQYEAVQTEIANIKALIELYKTEITAAYTKAIEDAIIASEKSMKQWVNETLANGYYDIAAIDAKLTTLKTELDNADADLQKQIEDQKAALEQAKKELTEAYNKAITEAIDKNNGIIRGEIADAVKKVIDNVNTKLAVIDNEIAAIKNDIKDIKEDIADHEKRIKSIEEQVKAINKSIGELNDVDGELQKLIDNLEAEVADLQSQIDNNAEADAATKDALEKEITNIKALIAALQEKDTELDKKIAELEAYVNSEITATEDWANATFSTLTQYEAVQTEIANIKALIELYKTEITATYTKAIEDAIKAIEISMKDWVNKTLAEGYYDIAAIDAKLNTLNNADADLQKQIEEQKAALTQASEELTAAYKTAIEEAITTEHGKITEEIELAVKKAQDTLQGQIDTINEEINSIKEDVNKLKGEVNYIYSLIRNIHSSIDSLNKNDSTLNLRIDSLAIVSKDLQTKLDETNNKIDELNNEMGENINNMKDRLNNLKDSIETNLDNINKLTTDIQEMGGRISALEDRLVDYETQVKQIETNTDSIAILNSLITKLQEDVRNAMVDITNLDTRIKSLEEDVATLKEDVTTLKEDVTTLKNDVAKLQDEVLSINQLITKLQNKDIELNDSIESLKETLTDLKMQMDSIDAATKDALEKAVANINALIVALQAKDEELSAKISSFETRLEGYEQALADIATNTGKINELINELSSFKETVITTLNTLTEEITKLNQEIENLRSRISNIEKELNDLKNNFASRIQSIVYIPQYSDGKAGINYENRSATIYFRISPANLAVLIQKENVTAFARETDNPSSRALNPEMSMIVESVNGNENGILEVTVKENTAEPFSEDFWNGEKEAIIYIHISDGNNDVTSELVQVVPSGKNTTETE